MSLDDNAPDTSMEDLAGMISSSDEPEGASTGESQGVETTPSNEGGTAPKEQKQEEALPDLRALADQLSLNDPEVRQQLRDQQGRYAPQQQEHYQPQQYALPQQYQQQDAASQQMQANALETVIQELGESFDPYDLSHQQKFHKALMQEELKQQLAPLHQFVQLQQQQALELQQQQVLNAGRETLYSHMKNVLPADHVEDLKTGKTPEDLILRDVLGKEMQRIASENYNPKYHDNPDVIKACMQHALKSQTFHTLYTKLKGTGSAGIPHTEGSRGGSVGGQGSSKYSDYAKRGDERGMERELSKLFK
jgi:hypothetical protein